MSQDWDGNARTGFSTADEQDALDRAYVPEHIPGLMAGISNGSPFRVGEYIGFVREKWMILVGYPLDGSFSQDRCEQSISRARLTYNPDTLFFIGPEIPTSLQEFSTNRSSDEYYRLDLNDYQPKSALRREVIKASERLEVVQETEFRQEHNALIADFLKPRRLPAMVAELYSSMPKYFAARPNAFLLCARDDRSRLNAFFVVEQAARNFDAYILGCYSRKPYIPHASDLLFSTMIDLTRASGKRFIQLGLGVNEGIKRFKVKWGGGCFR